jgi:curved DNA-binding protein CbpA
MNPYSILGIDKNYTEESLKKAYIRKAVKTHPDKGGDKDAFQQVTIAYTLLLKKLGEKDSDRQHYELKRGHEDYRESGPTQMKQNVQYTKTKGAMSTDSDRFDANLFNKIYDENRLGNVDDSGYGDWIEKNAMGDECEDNPKLFNGKFNKNLFHNVFNEHKQKNDKRGGTQIMQYEEPQALNSGGHQLQVLGKGNAVDFSSAEVLGNGVKYRDYKDAYTNSTLIDVASVNIGDRVGDIKSYKAQRSNVRHQMNAEEERHWKKIERDKGRQEEKRLRNLQRDDTRITDHYERVHKLLIRN